MSALDGHASSPPPTPRPRRTGASGLRFTALVWLAGLNAGCAQLAQLTAPTATAATTGAQPTAPTAATAASPAASAPATRLRLAVEAPSNLRSLLEKNLDLARLQDLPSDEAIDDSEWQRLVAVAPAQARELLQTEGYFDAQASASRQIEPGSALQQVRLQVQPGPRTLVASLQVTLRGELQGRIAAGDALARPLAEPLTSPGALRPGLPFRGPDWADTKQQWLARLRAAGYANAQLSDSQADVDTAAQRATLRLTLESGPLYRAGALQIEGLKHHDIATVRNLAGFEVGAALTEASLLDFQDRLQKAGLFESVSVSFDPALATAAASPVRVRLTELPLQQATVGLGISNNTGPRATLAHTHRRPFGWAATAINKLEWGRDAQSWTGDFQTHPGEGFYRNLLGVQVDRQKGASDTVLSQRLRLGRTQDTPRIERLYFIEWLRSKQSNRVDLTGASLAPITASALSANYNWVFRQLDSVLLPTRGVTLSLQGGAGQASREGGAGGPFARLYGRLTGYLPLGQNWYSQARVEAGQIVKSNALTVPDALGFRAGGDESVRGYAYRSLAPTGAEGSIVSGDMLLTTSVELAHPISANLPSVWGAVFLDAGRAVDHWGDWHPALGYGAGVRWRSPIGPLKVDLAWAKELRHLRLHFSVGIAF